jgi:hypothetical protein
MVQREIRRSKIRFPKEFFTVKITYKESKANLNGNYLTFNAAEPTDLKVRNGGFITQMVTINARYEEKSL